MKILVVGGGGREHAICKKISQSPLCDKLFCAPGNAGIADIAQCIDIRATDIDGVVNFSKENAIDLVVVAPDDPLVLGMVDALEAAGISAFGPRKNAAIIEGSKVFSKELMKKYNIPTAKYEVFDESAAAIEYLKTSSFPAVLKAEGLALGKGVIIAEDFKTAEDAVHDIMDNKIFGESGNRLVIEEFLQGPEISVLAFTDGEHISCMPSAQDHKRAYDYDKGLNTGGMGAFSPSKIYNEDMAKTCMETIFMPTIRAMKSEGRPFSGVLYFGLMSTKDGVKVIEYNCRFGDPETQAVLPRLKSDLVEIMMAVHDGTLDKVDISWDERPAVCVVLASGGYPVSYKSGYEITGIADAEAMDDITVYHAGTKKADDTVVTAGGRVLGVTALAENFDLAREKSYQALSKISFTDMHFRTDIGIK